MKNLAFPRLVADCIHDPVGSSQDKRIASRSQTETIRVPGMVADCIRDTIRSRRGGRIRISVADRDDPKLQTQTTQEYTGQ